jgi:hypothetical protein
VREEPLSKISDEPLRMRHAFSNTLERRTAPAGFTIDSALVSGLVAGIIAPQGEAELAQQVAQSMG